ncbi:MAG: hypothetical protein AAF518_08990 [Spirochaetota bacterium]
MLLLGIGFVSSLHAELPRQPYGLQRAHYWQFWFLYDTETRPAQKEGVFHPFYSKYTDRVTGHSFSSALYPIYYNQETQHWGRWSFFFLFGGRYTKHPDTGSDKDTSYGPFIWHGSGNTEKDRYFSVFPFYGKIKSAFGWSEVNFVLWPLYTNWSHKSYKAHSVLWPLTSYGKNEVRKEYRILPFYSHKSHIGKYHRTSVLWPLFQWGESNLDKVEPSSYGFFFPFYGYKKSLYGNLKSYTILYLPLPFYSYGYDRKTGATEYRALFSFIQYGYSNDKDYRKTIFFPFYGRSHFAKKTAVFITPLYFHLESDTYHIRSSSYYLIPFYFQSRRWYVKEKKLSAYYKLWPLFRYYKDKDGNLSYNSLTFLPVRSVYADKIWDPILSLFSYSKQINGEKKLSLLMSLYSQRWSRDDFHAYIPLLLDYSKTETSRKWEILYGLLGYTNEKKRSTFKLFWFIEL